MIGAIRRPAKGSDPSTAARRASRDEARVKSTAQANVSLGVNLTVGNILKYGKKQKEIASLEAASPGPPAVTRTQPSASYVLHIPLQKSCQVKQRRRF